jgi:hypothetical protein
LHYTNANTWYGAFEFLAPLFQQKLLMHHNEKPLSELQRQPDGHEGLSVAAGHTDQTIVAPVFEGRYNRQLLVSQFLVEGEFGPQVSPITPCIAFGFS